MRHDESATASRMSLVVMLMVLGMLASILFPNVRRARQRARGETCSANLKMLGLAIYDYHSVHKSLPYGCGGSDGGGFPEDGNANRLSGIVGLLPYIDEGVLWGKVRSPSLIDGVKFPAMGPVPSYDPKKYPYWGHQVSTFLCPEETVQRGDYGLRSYLLCYGDGTTTTHDPATFGRYATRGIFGRNQQLKFRDVSDGMAHTIMMGESAIGTGDASILGTVARDIEGILEAPSKALDLIDPQQPTRYRESVNIWEYGKGSRWADGSFRISGFNTVLPPGGPSCTADGDEWSGLMTASSHHGGGAHILLADGAVMFAFETIDTGDLSRPSVKPRSREDTGVYRPESPYGVWGSLGSRAGRELIPGEEDGSYVGAGKRARQRAKQIPSDPAEELQQRLDRIEKSLEGILRRLDQLESAR